MLTCLSRACAVFGGTYVLGPESIPESIELEDGAESSVRLKLPCNPRTITTKHLIASSGHLPPHLILNENESPSNTRRTAHCIAILSERPEILRKPEAVKLNDDDEDEEEVGEDDTAVIVFPPTSEDNGSVVRALMMGEGTGSCPSGQCEQSLYSI